jgi:transcriptional antiterminator NusG
MSGQQGTSGAAGERRWYVVRCATGREEFARRQLKRRVELLGLADKVGDILIPTERVTQIRGGRKTVRERKRYPGYVIVHMKLDDDTKLLISETPGLAGFVGTGAPTPLSEDEVARILTEQFAAEEERPRPKIEVQKGDTVRVKEGTFENFEGVVEEVHEGSGRVTVGLTIFGRVTRVDLEYWQIEKV